MLRSLGFDMGLDHATATLAELSLTMSIAAMVRIVRPPQLMDDLAIETLGERVKNEVSDFISKWLMMLCRFQNTWKRLALKIPQLAFCLQLIVLTVMAHGFEQCAHILFWVAFITMIVMVYWVILNRSLSSEEDSPPMVEPYA